VKLRDWQKDAIRKIYDNPAGTRTVIFTMGRKNAKSALAAFLLLVHMAGPEKRLNSQLYSDAQSRDQASVIFELAAKMVRMSPSLSSHFTVRDTAKQLLCPEFGTKYRALSAEVATSFGLSPAFIIHDELGQVRGPKSELYEALETATAAQEAPLSIIISTQAPTDGDLLSILMDDAESGLDERVVLIKYSADIDLDPFSEEAVCQANPAYGDFQNKDEVLAMAEAAKRMPSREASYRNLVLNQRIEATNPFISRSTWNSCVGEVAERFTGDVYGGLDLSATTDLTALVLISKVKDVYQVKPTFWLPEHGLAERSRLDRSSYDVWAREGYLKTTEGKSVEYEFVANEIWELSQEMKIKKIGFDRWGFRNFKPWLLRAGFTEDQIEKLFFEFGQGFQSMSPALRTLESLILNGKLVHDNHPVLSMCAACAVVTKDPAGNRKLNKAKSHGRIDGMVALAMAASVAETAENVPAPKYELMFV
jgi:phage terminase large subunit-like protein